MRNTTTIGIVDTMSIIPLNQGIIWISNMTTSTTGSCNNLCPSLSCTKTGSLPTSSFSVLSWALHPKGRRLTLACLITTQDSGMSKNFKFLLSRNSKESDDDEGSSASSSLTPFHPCTRCGDDVPAQRWYKISKLCLFCGEEAAVLERASWCVVQPYNKGPYMLVTVSSAPQTLMDTNQKATRS